MNTILNEWLDRHKISLLSGGMLLMFIKADPVLRLFDFSAASLDIGILTVVPLVGLMMFTFILLTHFLIRHYWPDLADYSKLFFTESFKSLVSWQKLLFYTVFFFGLFWAFVITLVAVL